MARLPEEQSRTALEKIDLQLLSDAGRVKAQAASEGREIGNLVAAKELKKAHRTRYARVQVTALKKRLDRAEKRYQAVMLGWDN